MGNRLFCLAFQADRVDLDAGSTSLRPRKSRNRSSRRLDVGVATWCRTQWIRNGINVSSKSQDSPQQADGSSRLSDLPSHRSPNDYPLDPYQLRVSGTTTSLIFSKYGGPILCESFLTVIAKAQYEIVQAIVAARGDGPVSQPNFEWCEQKLYLRISRPLAREDLTWLMLADTLEGTRGFFAGRGWFETEITILDDTAGPVGGGSITFW